MQLETLHGNAMVYSEVTEQRLKSLRFFSHEVIKSIRRK